jgi:hypothetical protein
MESVRSLFMSGSEIMPVILPFSFYLKLGAFLILAFLGVVQLFFRVNTLYYSVWSQRYNRPHPLHVSYSPDNHKSMMALLSWKVYRLLILLAPPVIMGVVTLGVGAIELFLFNQFSGGLPFISLPIQFIVALFIMMLLGLFTGLACVNTAWAGINTVLGDVIAVTEPDLATKTIYERCGRIAFSSSRVYFFYAGYALFVLCALVEIVLLLVNYDIQDIITLQANFAVIFGGTALTLAAYLVLNAFKLDIYHHALMNYYAAIPQSVKERYINQSSIQSVGDLYKNS